MAAALVSASLRSAPSSAVGAGIRSAELEESIMFGAKLASCVALAAGLSVAGFVVPTSSAFAGTNGQQIRVTFVGPFASSVTTVTIKGHNQGGAKATWYGIAPASNHSETTTSWWWAGPVSITTHYVEYDEYGVDSCTAATVSTVTIPTDYSSNVFPVTIPLDSECG
jgi:hypothetical protein